MQDPLPDPITIGVTTVHCPVDHRGGYVVVYRWSAPSGGQQTPVLLVPDLGESASDFANTAEKFALANVNAYSFDSRGYGQSPGMSIDFKELVSDLLQICAMVRKQEGGETPILISHGIGALLMMFLAQTHPQFIGGIVLTSTILTSRRDLNPYKRFCLRFLARISPTMIIPQVLHPKFTSKGAINPKKVTAILAIDLIMGITQAGKILRRMKVPTLILNPAKDPTRADSLKRLLLKAKYPDRISVRHIDLESLRLINAPNDEIVSQVLEHVQVWILNLQSLGNTDDISHSPS